MRSLDFSFRSIAIVFSMTLFLIELLTVSLRFSNRTKAGGESRAFFRLESNFRAGFMKSEKPKLTGR